MSGSISISGLLQNMLDEGFNTKDCICEMIDDSLGAGSKHIRISLDTINKQLNFIDDGCGMTKDELRDAHILHNRTEPTVLKHGRFGIGRKHAVSHFTQNKHIMKTISKSMDTGVGENIEKGVSELDIDYANAIKKNYLEMNPHEVSVSSLEIWKKNAIFSNKKGTITSIRIDNMICEKITAGLNSTDLFTSLRYTLGLNYNQIIKDEVKISFVLDGKDIPIIAYDPLGISTTLPQNKAEYKIQIYTDTISKETRYCFINAGKLTYRKVNPTSGLIKNFTDSMPSSFKRIGEISLCGSYSSDWIAPAKPILTKMGVILPEKKLDSKNLASKKLDSNKLDSAELLGGMYIQRNNKIISRFAIVRPSSGDFAKREVTINSHFLLKFQASEVIDDLFKVMTNKSKLDETNINKELWDTVTFLQKKFVDDHYIPPAPAPAPAPAPVPAPATATPAPVGVTVPVTTVASAGATTAAPSVAHKPSAPIAPILPPLPSHDITFSKTNSELIVLVKNKETYRIPYVGQYHHWEDVCTQVLMKIGPARFDEWIHALAKTNKLLV